MSRFSYTDGIIEENRWSIARQAQEDAPVIAWKAEIAREERLDKAVRQATWSRSAFGTKAELRRMWEVCLKNHHVEDRLHREILGFWYKPATDGAYV